MKKYLLVLLVLSSCSKKMEDKKNYFVVSQDTLSVNYADSVEIALTKTENIDVEIKQKINRLEVLNSENKHLKVELKTAKDCLSSTQEELKILRTNVKFPKKKNFIQRILGVKTDSIVVEKVDTIKN
jgi:hypothetical protein